MTLSPAPNLVVIAGPSGAGKSALTAAISKLSGAFVVPRVTTRAKRSASAEGEDSYRFVSASEFVKLRGANEFLISAEWASNQYGLLTGDLEAVQGSSLSLLDTIFDAKSLRQALEGVPGANALFLQIYLASFQRVEEGISRRLGACAEAAQRITEAQNLILQRHDYDWMLENTGDNWTSAMALLDWLKGNGKAPSFVIHPNRLEADAEFNLSRVD